MNDFEYTSCNNDKCCKKRECKRYQMYLMGADDFKTNGGTEKKPCKRFLAMKG